LKKIKDRALKLLRKILLTLLLFHIIFNGNNCGENTVVARVGNYVIPSNDFRKSFLDDKSLQQAQKMPVEKKLDHLNGMIKDQLVLKEAYKNRLDSTSSITRVLYEYEKRLIFQNVAKKEIIDKVITNNKIKEQYFRSAREAKLKHIFVKLNKDATPSQKDTLKRTMFDLRYSLLRGKSFETAARTLSEDSSSRGKGGELGFVKWGAHNYGDRFYKQVFDLKEGTISQPILSSQGYHLVKLEKYRPTGVGEFKHEKEAIKQKLTSLQQKELRAAYDDFYEKCKRHYGYVYNNENIGFLSLKLFPKEKNRQQKLNKYNLPELSMKENDRPLVNYAGGKYTAGQFILDINKLPSFKRRSLSDSVSIKSFLNSVLAKDLLVKWGYDKGIKNNRDVKKDLLQKKHDLMINEMRKIASETFGDFTNKDLLEYFNSNKEKYKEPEKFKVREILVGNLDVAKKIIDMNKKIVFKDLAKAYNTRPTTKGNNGLLGFITKNQYGNIGPVAASLEIGEVSNPIKVGNQYSVIKVMNKTPEKLANLDAVKEKVTSDFRKMKLQNDLSKWIDQLKKTTIIAVYESQLKRALN
jgi:peptidyl-prolyl cis-trans isomerase C